VCVRERESVSVDETPVLWYGSVNVCKRNERERGRETERD